MSEERWESVIGDDIDVHAWGSGSTRQASIEQACDRFEQEQIGCDCATGGIYEVVSYLNPVFIEDRDLDAQVLDFCEERHVAAVRCSRRTLRHCWTCALSGPFQTECKALTLDEEEDTPVVAWLEAAPVDDEGRVPLTADGCPAWRRRTA